MSELTRKSVKQFELTIEQIAATCNAMHIMLALNEMQLDGAPAIGECPDIKDYLRVLRGVCVRLSQVTGSDHASVMAQSRDVARSMISIFQKQKILSSLVFAGDGGVIN
jgi:hypothetical protein